MRLYLTGSFETDKRHSDMVVVCAGRPGKWIFRVVWGREWCRRPKNWRPFEQDPGGYHKRMATLHHPWGGPMFDWAMGHFAVILYRTLSNHRAVPS